MAKQHLSSFVAGQGTLWRGTGKREPGRTVGGRGTETGEERAGSGISTMTGSRRKIQKGKLSLFVTDYIQSKK